MRSGDLKKRKACKRRSPYDLVIDLMILGLPAQKDTIEFSQFRRFVLGIERERKSSGRFLQLAKVVELETDNGRDSKFLDP